jgi:hypothetical protein
MVNKIKKKLKELQDTGFPIIFARDPLTKLPSVSLTLLLIAFCLTVFSLINKFTKIVDGVDVDNTLELLIVCASLYFGRAFSKKVNKD